MTKSSGGVLIAVAFAGGAALAVLAASAATPTVSALPPIPNTDFHLYPPGTPCFLGPGPLGKIVAYPVHGSPGQTHHICEQLIPGTDGFYE
ncbi:hypothetical protein [Nocardia sp. CY41]|uniref:hypothetical protein n=1 Tax=Nocardia sp. CY41 TaxID=2608686 RepID=UPI00135CC1E1|nr:hypothetical protein [Nocardia sp. CY41]